MAGSEDQAKGQWEETKGKAKQAWGDMTDNQEMQSEGQAEETKGKGRQALGKAKDAVSSALNRDDDK